MPPGEQASRHSMGGPPGGVTAAQLKATSGKKAFDSLPPWKSCLSAALFFGRGKSQRKRPPHTDPVDPVPFNTHPVFPHVSRLLSYSMSTR